MSTLKQLKRRMTSISGTRKIIKAMQIVSSTRMKTYYKHAISSAATVEAITSVISPILENIGEDTSAIEDVLLGKTTNKCSLYIIITSERGLCGGFNSLILRKFVAEAQDLISQGQSFKIIIVGKKGYTYLKNSFRKEIIKCYPSSNGFIEEQTAFSIMQDIIDAISSKEVDNCVVYFNKFKNVLVQIPTAQQILPLIDVTPPDSSSLYTLEGKSLSEDLIHYYIAINMYNILLGCKISEEAARMTAMDNAMKNATDMLNALKIQINRTRQSLITKELMEIISGVEAAA